MPVKLPIRLLTADDPGFDPTQLPFMGAFTPLSLFAAGEQGAWYDPSDLTTLYQDSAGTTPVTTDGDPVGLRQDKSGNGNDQTQSTTSAKTIYNDASGFYSVDTDGVDDSMTIEVPTGGWTGTYVQGTRQGVIVGEISVPAGAYQIPTNPIYDNAGSDTQLIIRNDGGAIDPAELDQLVGYAGRRGAVADFAGETSAQNWFRDRSDFVSLDCSRWDTSSCTRFDGFVYNCPNLETLDVSNWDTSAATTFSNFAYSCLSLKTLDVSNWDTSSCTRFDGFVYNCSGLKTLDVSNWDTSSCTIFNSFARNCSSLSNVVVYGGTGSPFADSPCTSYTNAFTNTNLTQQSIDDILTAIESAGTSNGTFNQSGGSAPSATGEAAIDALRARGWTVTVTGAY